MTRPSSRLCASSVPIVLCCLIAPSPAVRAQVGAFLEVPPGFEAPNLFNFDPSLPPADQLGGLAYSAAGEPVVYHGGRIVLHAASGSRVLAVFAPPVFGSFLALAPDGRSYFFGESSSGGIYIVPGDGSGPTDFDHIALNFDLALAPATAPATVRGLAFVSAPGPKRNAIHLLDGDPAQPNDVVIAGIPGFSGPLAFDPDGNLYYATSAADFSAEGGENGQRFVRFTPEQLAAGIGAEAVDFSAGEVLGRETDGYFNLRWLDGRLYGSNLGFGLTTAAVEVFDPTDDFARSVFAVPHAGEGLASPTFLAARPGEATFEAGSGRRGGSLLVAYSDFFSASSIAEVTPELHFVRGRINGDEKVDVSDAVYLLVFLFLGGGAPEVPQAADVNADSGVDIADAVYLLSFLFRGGPSIPAPFPDPGPAP
jgi:hypothetical protein